MGFVLQVVSCRNNYQWKDSRQRHTRNLGVLTVCFAIITLVHSDYVNETLAHKNDCYKTDESQEVYFEFSSKIIDNGKLVSSLIYVILTMV